MKYNIKKEFDEEVKYLKGLLNQSYNQLFVPMALEITLMLQRISKSAK